MRWIVATVACALVLCVIALYAYQRGPGRISELRRLDARAHELEQRKIDYSDYMESGRSKTYDTTPPPRWESADEDELSAVRHRIGELRADGVRLPDDKAK